MKIAYKPEKLNIDIKAKLFAAGQRSLAIVDEKNTVIKFVFRFIPKTVSFLLLRRKTWIQ